MAKLTKRVVEAFQSRDREYFEWDDDLPRFGVRILPSGRKTFVIQYRVNRRSRRMNLGSFGILTPDVARGRALQTLGMVEAGEDPLNDRRARERAVTVKELAQTFETRHIDLNPNLKASTGREYRHALNRYILPALGRLKVADVTRADVSALHLSMAAKPYQANRTLEVVSKMFNLAEEWGHRAEGTNPRKRIKKYPEQLRRRNISFKRL